MQKRYFYLFLLSLITFSSVFSQENEQLQQQIAHLIDKADSALQSDQEKAIFELNEALRLSEQIDDSSKIAEIRNFLGRAYTSKSDFNKGFENYYDALSYLRNSKDKVMRAAVHNNIGLLYGSFGLYDEALEYLMESERLIEQDLGNDVRNNYNFLLLNLSMLKGYQGKNEESLQYALKAEKMLPKTAKSSEQEQVFRMAITTNQKARAYHKLGKIDTAKAILERNLKVIIKESEPFNLGKNYFYLSDIHYTLKDHKKALFYVEKANSVAENINDLASRREIYLLASKLHEESGNITKAHYYLKKGAEMLDQVFDVKETWGLYKIERDFETREKAQKIAQLEKDQQTNNTLRLLYALGIILIVFCGVLIFKSQRVKHLKEKEKINQLQRITNIELEKTKEVLEIKKKELTSAALQIIENGETVQAFKKELDGFKKNLDKVHHKKLEALATSITNNSNKNWEEFKSRFEQVNTNFFKNLRQQYPTLTSNELKLCSFLKLNFNSKDIANLMGISPESVKVSRYRLRKKMELDRSENLVNHIDQF